MAIEIVIDRSSDIHEKLEWIAKRIPTNEYKVLYESDIDWDENLVITKATVIVWSNDADRVAVEFWWQNK